MLLVDGSKCFSTLLESFDAITTTPTLHRYKHTAVGLSHVSRSDRRHRCRYSRRAFGCGCHLGMYSFQQKRYVTASARFADNEAGLTDSACTARSRPTMRRRCTRRTSGHSAHHHAQEVYCLYHILSQPIPVESLPNPMFGYLGGPLYRAARDENCHCFSEEEGTF